MASAPDRGPGLASVSRAVGAVASHLEARAGRSAEEELRCPACADTPATVEGLPAPEFAMSSG